MSNTEQKNIISKAFYEQIKQELSALPSDEELRELFPVTEEKREKFIKRVYKKKKPAYMLYLQRVAVIALAVITASFGLLMTNDDICAGVLEKGVKWFDEYIQFDFSEDKSDYTVDFDNIEIGYIPEGYELIHSSIYDDSHNYVYYNDNNDGNIGIAIITDSTNISKRTSNEYRDFDQIIIDGFNGYTSYDKKNNSSIVVWGNYNFQIYISGTIKLEETLKIAYNLNIEYQTVNGQ